MTTVAFVGLGIMGTHMARHLVAAGHAVRGYDRNPAALDTLAGNGGTPVGSVAEALDGAEVLITMVPDSPQVLEVVTGPGGLLDSVDRANPGLVYVDMSTIRPDVSVEVARLCAEKGIAALDAPVSGGEKGAIEASLSIMVGGDAEAFATVEPLLTVMGGTVALLGPAGAGQTVKAANQLIVAGTYQLVAEAIAFLEAFGVDADAAIDTLRGGLAGSRILDLKGHSMVARQFAPGFRIDLHHKDMGIIVNAAREAGVVLPVGALMAQLMQSARQNGDGGLDHSALLRGVLRLNGKPLEG